MTNKPRLPPRPPIDPDLVDRIFDYLSAEYPAIVSPRMDELKAAVRAEFKGEEVYISNRSAVERHRQAQRVLALFNGRNAREVARRLGISRATVYRSLKQAGRLQAGGPSLSFPGNETGEPVRSRRDRRAEPAVDAPSIAVAATTTD